MNCHMNKNFGVYIFEARKSKKMSQEQLGEKLGINSKSVSKWERNIAYPSLKHLCQLCDILELDEKEMLSFIKLAFRLEK